MVITLDIAKVNVDKVVVNTCSFGKLSTVTMKLELNNGFRLFLPVINKKLAAADIVFPSNFFGIFKLTNLKLGYYDNYIYAGATPIFLAPTIEEVILQ